MALYPGYLHDYRQLLERSVSHSNAVMFLKNKVDAWDLKSVKHYLSIGSCKFLCVRS